MLYVISTYHYKCTDLENKGATGVEPVTAGSAIPCSATELHARVVKKHIVLEPNIFILHQYHVNTY